jgi:hypothetical protein
LLFSNEILYYSIKIFLFQYEFNKNFKVSTVLGPCCKDQYNKEKYPFLKTPDYAFENDFLDRKNFFNKKFCKIKGDSLDINCENIVV